MRRGLHALLLLATATAAWGMEPAATLRLPQERIDAAVSYSRKTGGRALLILQGGQSLHESYANGGSATQPELVLSITKNLAALTVLAAQTGRLLTLDEPASKTLTEWRGSGPRSRITIRELLQQTSGLSDGYNAIYARGVRDKNKAALALSSVATPGSIFHYDPGNYELIEEILRRKLAARGTDPLSYLTAKILMPLGIRPSPDWRRDRKGNPFFSAGARLTARDLAKIGEFVRTRGRVWIVPILPSAVFNDAFAGSAANSMYGLSFWLNTNAARAGAAALSIEGTLGERFPPERWRGSCLSPVAPPDLIAMVGSGGQRCYVVPSRKLVVVRLGRGRSFEDAEMLRRLFARR
jgi:CubicO group peptidase (beta-lactamase class C family)